MRLANGAPGSLLTSARTRRGARTPACCSRDERGGATPLPAFVQDSSKERGAFADVLDAMTVLLHERSREAARAGDGAAAAASARGVQFVEDAKRAAEGNAVPQLVSARLLRRLEEAGR